MPSKISPDGWLENSAQWLIGNIWTATEEISLSDKMSFKPHRLARKFPCSKSRHDIYQSTNNKDADQTAGM